MIVTDGEREIKDYENVLAEGSVIVGGLVDGKPTMPSAFRQWLCRYKALVRAFPILKGTIVIGIVQ